jgi:hypothetical protein
VNFDLASAKCKHSFGTVKLPNENFSLASAKWGPWFFPNVNFVVEEVQNVNFVLSSAKSELHICQVLNVSTRAADVE